MRMSAKRSTPPADWDGGPKVLPLPELQQTAAGEPNASARWDTLACITFRLFLEAMPPTMFHLQSLPSRGGGRFREGAPLQK